MTKVRTSVTINDLAVRKDGTPTGWKGSLRWQVRWFDASSGKKASKGFADEAAAKRFQANLEHQLEQEAKTELAGFEATALAWFRSTKHLKPNTRRVYWLKLTSHIIPHFHKTPIAAIDAAMVQAFIDAKLAPSVEMPAGYNPKNVRDMVSILSQVMEFAKAKNLRHDNPARGITVPVPKKPKRRDTDANFLSVDDAELIVQHSRKPYGTLVWALIFTGIRPQEACGLTVENFNHKSRCFFISETLNYVHGFDDETAQLHRGPTKTTGGEREVYIPQWLADEIQEMLDERARIRGRRLRPHEPLWESVKGGRPLKVPDLRRRIIRPALVAAGLDPSIRTYDTRHSAATFWIDSGMPLPQVRKLMGHAPGSRVLEETYYHPEDEALRAAADLMDQARKSKLDDLKRKDDLALPNNVVPLNRYRANSDERTSDRETR